MAGGYVLCEYDSVKSDFPEFRATMQSLELTLRAKAAADWSPLSYGGISPRAGQFGKTTIMPQLFDDVSGTMLNTWHQWFTAIGNQTIITGVNAGGIIPEDYKVGLAGLVLLDKAIRISEIRMQISDKKLPRINIEEALAYNKPAIVFEEGYVLDEETSFDLYAYVTTQGPQRIQLLGLQMNRVPNRLQVTNTGAAL